MMRWRSSTSISEVIQALIASLMDRQIMSSNAPAKSPKNQVGRHRARTFVDNLFRIHQRACRRGDHRFGAPQRIGAGIQRTACSVCGSVSIDLRDVHDEHPPSLIRPTRAAGRFAR